VVCFPGRCQMYKRPLALTTRNPSNSLKSYSTQTRHALQTHLSARPRCHCGCNSQPSSCQLVHNWPNPVLQQCPKRGCSCRRCAAQLRWCCRLWPQCPYRDQLRPYHRRRRIDLVNSSYSIGMFAVLTFSCFPALPRRSAARITASVSENLMPALLLTGPVH
jgi:hypothetical protein